MKVISFDGKEYKINLTKHCCANDNSSELHNEARALLNKKFPISTIAEEVILVGCVPRYAPLKADFLIPNLKIIVEVHGKQHYEFCKHFHKNEKKFALSKMNDKYKQEWCALNNIVYIELPYNQKDKWESIINEHIGR